MSICFSEVRFRLPEKNHIFQVSRRLPSNNLVVSIWMPVEFWINAPTWNLPRVFDDQPHPIRRMIPIVWLRSFSCPDTNCNYWKPQISFQNFAVWQTIGVRQKWRMKNMLRYGNELITASLAINFLRLYQHISYPRWIQHRLVGKNLSTSQWKWMQVGIN